MCGKLGGKAIAGNNQRQNNNYLTTFPKSNLASVSLHLITELISRHKPIITMLTDTPHSNSQIKLPFRERKSPTKRISV